MSWLVNGAVPIGETAAKAALIYATALFFLRASERRTIAQWTAVDFAAAVAIGAIVGRTAVASNQSYAVGAVALATLLVVHRLVNVARFHKGFSRLVDHRVRLLVVDGRIRTRELRLCSLTDEDLLAQLRQRGYRSLDQLRYVFFEAKGGLTVVPEAAEPDGPLVTDAKAAAGEPPAGR